MTYRSARSSSLRGPNSFSRWAEQLRAAEILQAAVSRDVLLDIFFDHPRQFLEQRLVGQRGHVVIVGGENSLEVGKLIEDAGAERIEWDLDFAEQPGNKIVDFASYER